MRKFPALARAYLAEAVAVVPVLTFPWLGMMIERGLAGGTAGEYAGFVGFFAGIVAGLVAMPVILVLLGRWLGLVPQWAWPAITWTAVALGTGNILSVPLPMPLVLMILVLLVPPFALWAAERSAALRRTVVGAGAVLVAALLVAWL